MSYDFNRHIHLIMTQVQKRETLCDALEKKRNRREG